MPSAALAPRTSSKYGRCHPPCRNPPSVSSSGDPGPCITPSRDKNSITRSILIVHLSSFRSPAPCRLSSSMGRLLAGSARRSRRRPTSRRCLLETVAADVVGGVYGLVGTGVRALAARERAVFTPRAGEGCVERSVRHRDRHVVPPDVPGSHRNVVSPVMLLSSEPTSFPSMVQVPTRRSRRLSAGSGCGRLGFSDMTFLLCWVQSTFCLATRDRLSARN